MAAPLLQLPPDCGERTLPAAIDAIAKTDGARPIVSIPRTDSVDDGYVDITFASFARAVDYCARWLDENVPKESRRLFYFAPLDIRYLIVMIAACKTGRVMFYSSHRNSLEAHLSLLDAVQCATVLVPEKAPAALKQILLERPMQAIDFPSLANLLNPGHDVPEYGYSTKFHEVKDETFVILHTSGSTGIPKPVHVTHGTFASNDAHQLIPSLGGRPTLVDYLRGRRFLIALPLFHAACIGMWAIGVYAGLTPVVPPPGPLTADVVNTINTTANVSGSLMPPSLIVDIYNNAEFLENMINRLDCVSYVGGTLATEVGDYVSKNLKLLTLFGTTENMYYPLEIHDRPIDWSYISLSPQLGHIYREWQDGLGELVIVRNSVYQKIQGVFSTFPALNEYETKDLYERHPTRSNLWRFSGRSDDIICFNNAEKLNPITMETIVMTHPEVHSAIIGGTGEFQASILIEPKIHPANEQDARALIDRIWPSIHKANRSCPAHGRLVKNLIMLSDPERPLPKAGKTTVQRYAAMKLYQQDFKNIYMGKKASIFAQEDKIPQPQPTQANGGTLPSKAVSGTQPASRPGSTQLHTRVHQFLQGVEHHQLPDLLGSMVAEISRRMFQLQSTSMHSADPRNGEVTTNGVPPPATTVNSAANGNAMKDGVHGDESHPPFPKDLEGIKEIVHTVLTQTTYLDSISNDSNFFDHGLDSIQIKGFIEEINSRLGEGKAGHAPLQMQVVYRNPTIDQLASVLQIASA